MNKEIFNLLAREDFTCLGTDCSRDCCHGWDFIEVDKETVEKWSNVTDPVDKDMLSGFLKMQEDESPVMRTTENKVCLALDNQKLCSIQGRFGHDFISETCRKFPRMEYHNKFRGYNTASLSCPDIVDRALFNSNTTELFSLSDEQKEVSNNSGNDDVLAALDLLLSEILDLDDNPVGNVLFFVSDIFSDIINNLNMGMVSESDVRNIRINVSGYLADIKKAVKQGKIKPNPVTSGSYWKTIHSYCKSRGVKSKFLEGGDSALEKVINRCDDTFPGYSKVYAVIKQYRKKANKQVKQQYNAVLRKYIKLLFINKGFPLIPKSTLSLVLIECMVNVSVLQLLIWIETNKNGKITDKFLKECIVEVDRKFVQGNVLVKTLEQDGHMSQIEKYCNSFLDIF